MQLPMTGRPIVVIEDLRSIISYNIRRRAFDEFYVGRSVDLVATRYRHGCDLIAALYQTSSQLYAMDVEDYLIKTFHHHRKCSNDAIHCGGGGSGDFINFVYLALWLR